MLRENREDIILKKNHILYFILALILIPSIILLARSAMMKGKEKEDTASEPEAPATLEQVVEEFNEEFAEDGETVDPDTFSEYVDEYVVEVQEGDVADIN
jgi:hypothetical protein